MPKLHEKERKIKILKSGGNVRAPKHFWDKIKREVKKEYPHYSDEKINQIVAGIWNKYNTNTKIEIVKEYQNVLGKRY